MQLTPEQIGEIAHEANRTFRRFLGESASPMWGDVSTEMKASTVAGVKAVLFEPQISARELHARWMGYKIAAGWTYGKVQDNEKKLHPNLVLFDKLPPEQRMKDALFQGIVKALISEVDPMEIMPK